MSSQRYLNGRSAAASREFGAPVASAGLIDGHGDLDAAHPGMAVGVADAQSTAADMDERDSGARSHVAGTDPKHTQSRPCPTTTSVSNLKLGQSQEVVPCAAAREDYQGPTYLDGHPKALDTNRAKQGRSYRRVGADKTTGLRQHLGVPESISNAPDKSAEGGPPAEGISAFLGRLLDQLSLSAWLPAAMLVGSLSVLLQLHAQKNRDVAEAATNLVNKPLGLLVVLLFALVLATMVTQAFEFEVIRLLEGYWGDRFFARGILRLSVGHQERKFYSLCRKRGELTLRAFREANLLADTGVEARGWREKRRAREAQKYKEEWRQFAPANLMSRLDAVESQIREYPKPYRMLPTKLGNVIRAVEDSIKTTQGDDLESFVIRQWDEIPSGLRKEHDQYRGRLDLYCTLMFVFLILGIISAPLVTRGPHYLFATVTTSIVYLFLSFVSYAAAIASARGYGTALRAIDAMNSAGKVWHRSRA